MAGSPLGGQSIFIISQSSELVRWRAVGEKQVKSYASVGQLEGREEGNRRKCSQSALKSSLGSALGSAPEGGLPVILCRG